MSRIYILIGVFACAGFIVPYDFFVLQSLAPFSPFNQITSAFQERNWLEKSPFAIKKGSPFYSENPKVEGIEFSDGDLISAIAGKKWDMTREKEWTDRWEEQGVEFDFLGEVDIQLNGKRIQLMRIQYKKIIFNVSKKLIVRVGSEEFFKRLYSIMKRIDEDFGLAMRQRQYFLLPLSGSQDVFAQKENLIGVNQEILDLLKGDQIKKYSLAYLFEAGIEMALRENIAGGSPKELRERGVFSMMAAAGTPGLLKVAIEEIESGAEVNPLFKEEIVLKLLEKQNKSRADWLRANLDKRYPRWDDKEGETLRFYLRYFFDQGFLFLFEYDKIPPGFSEKDIGTTLAKVYQAVQKLPPWFVRTRDVLRELAPLTVSFDQDFNAQGQTKIRHHNFYLSTAEDLIVNVNNPFETDATFFHELAHFRVEQYKGLLFGELVAPLRDFKNSVGISDEDEAKIRNLYDELIAYTSEGGNVSSFIGYAYHQGANTRLSPLDRAFTDAVEVLNEKVGLILKVYLFRNPEPNEDGTYTYIWPYVADRKIKVIEGRLRKKENGTWEEERAPINALEKAATAAMPNPMIDSAI